MLSVLNHRRHIDLFRQFSIFFGIDDVSVCICPHEAESIKPGCFLRIYTVPRVVLCFGVVCCIQFSLYCI